MDITLIGAGNVAWHLAQALEKAGHPILSVYSRTYAHAEALAGKFKHCRAINSLDFSECTSQLYILAISDDAIEQVVNQLVLAPDAILVHTSGAQPMLVLSPFPRIGVLYPLQTFSKNKGMNLQYVPMCIEANEPAVEQVLRELAGSISQSVHVVSSAERKVLHVAAVFACNFSNHLLALSKSILDKEGINFELLKPLISETFTKALSVEDPASVQTGPAARNDTTTIRNHLEYLRTHPELAKLYQTLTVDIIRHRRDMRQ